MSDHVLTDKESVDLGMKKIEQDYAKCISEESSEGLNNYLVSWIVYQVAEAYNGGNEHYSEEVMDVFTRLNEKVYTNIPEYFDKMND